MGFDGHVEAAVPGAERSEAHQSSSSRKCAYRSLWDLVILSSSSTSSVKRRSRARYIASQGRVHPLGIAEHRMSSCLEVGEVLSGG